MLHDCPSSARPQRTGPLERWVLVAATLDLDLAARPATRAADRRVPRPLGADGAAGPERESVRVLGVAAFAAPPGRWELGCWSVYELSSTVLEVTVERVYEPVFE